MADVARQNNFVRPVLVNEPCLEIIGGRHPLQELCVDHFVPNDTSIGGEHGSIKLITGPNASGKSVYLKQVALIAYLAHIGSFVPADKATIGILDHIRTRIQTVESCSAQMSAFFIDLKQMMHCVYSSTPNSLLVIDEFGKGTTEVDGQALLASCLDHFLRRGSACPLIFASTHFHRVPRILEKLSSPMNALSLQRMAHVMEGDELVCLHRIEPGEAGSSFAHLAAKCAGFNTDTLQFSYNRLNNPDKYRPNPKLKLTKHMLEEIKALKEFLALAEEDSPPGNSSSP